MKIVAFISTAGLSGFFLESFLTQRNERFAFLQSSLDKLNKLTDRANCLFEESNLDEPRSVFEEYEKSISMARSRASAIAEYKGLSKKLGYLLMELSTLKDELKNFGVIFNHSPQRIILKLSSDHMELGQFILDKIIEQQIFANLIQNIVDARLCSQQFWHKKAIKKLDIAENNFEKK